MNKVGRAQKGPSNIKYEDITILCGTALARNFYEWIGSACSGRNSRKSGAVSAGDFNYKEISRTEWTGGIISEVAFPPLDASSKEAAHMTVRISPEGVRWVKGGGRDLRSGIRKQARWQASNFRLNIPGVDCKHVSKIDSLTIQNGPRHSFSNLVATFSEADTATWVEWENSQRKRGAGQGGGKSGRLDYLGPDMREVLFSLTFQNLQLTQLATKGSSPRASVHNAKATMSFQGMIFSYSNAA